jgi:sugar-specific transcriptional regulator TrmB
MSQDAIQDLQSLGFSEYEARAYVALLQRGPLTGYQLAKASGIPRPNIYPVLDRLQERGAVGRLEVPDGTQYTALPAEEMLQRLGRDADARLERAHLSMKELDSAPETALVWNVRGFDLVIERARELIDSAQDRLLIGTWSNEARELAAATAAAVQRGVTVATLCIQDCAEECGGCRGDVYRYPLADSAGERWLVVAVDDRELLVGQMSPGRAVAGVTTLEVFVAVGSQYLLNAIATAEIARSLGPRMAEVLDEQALRALRSAGLATGESTWMERMLALASRGDA